MIKLHYQHGRHLLQWSKGFIVFFLLISQLIAWNNPRIGYYTKKGEKAYSKGRLDSARDHLLKAIANSEPTGEAAFFLANIYEIKKQYSECLYYLHKALKRGKLGKEYTKAALWKAIVYSEYAGDYAAVIKYIERLESFRVNKKKLEKIKIRAQEKLTPENMRIRDIEKLVMEKEAQLENPAKNLAMLPLMKELLPYYKELMLLDPKQKSLLWKIAEIYEYLGEFQKARRSYLKLAEHLNSPQAWYKVGYLEKKAGLYSQSLDSFSKVLGKENLPRRLEYFTRMNAAQAQLALMKYEKALMHAKHAESLADEAKHSKKANIATCLAAVSPYEGRIEGLPQIKAKIKSYCNLPKEPNSGLSSRDRFLFRYGQWKAAWVMGYPDDELNVRLQQILIENGTLRLPRWLVHESRELARQFYEDQSYQQLTRLLSLKIPNIEASLEIKKWKLASYIDSEQYGEAAILLQEKQSRNIEENRFLIKSLFVMKMDNRIIGLIQKYQKENKSEAVQLIEWVDMEKSYERLHLSSEYAELRSEVLGIFSEETVDSQTVQLEDSQILNEDPDKVKPASSPANDAVSGADLANEKNNLIQQGPNSSVTSPEAPKKNSE